MPLWEYPQDRLLVAPYEVDGRLNIRPWWVSCLSGAGGIPGIGVYIHALYDDK
jgi:hypothetical protein